MKKTKTSPIKKFQERRPITREEHAAIHKQLHQSLMSLVHDFRAVTRRQLEGATLLELIGWSSMQVENPESIPEPEPEPQSSALN